MKALTRFLMNKRVKVNIHRYHPMDYDELKQIILDLLNNGQNNLNCIDVSKIVDFSFLFSDINEELNVKGKDVENIDISYWDLSAAKITTGMFMGCNKFTSDLSWWNMDNVIDASDMFNGCTLFESDLSKWKLSSLKNAEGMFSYCSHFNSDLSKWDVSKVTDMRYMFWNCSRLNTNLSKWKVDKKCNKIAVFHNCYAMKHLPMWYGRKK